MKSTLASKEAIPDSNILDEIQRNPAVSKMLRGKVHEVRLRVSNAAIPRAITASPARLAKRCKAAFSDHSPAAASKPQL
jgi:hypothetical protein